jgi:hypothetical protein
MPKITCPTCGQRGQTEEGSKDFESRGQWEGRPVRKCLNCGAGLTVVPSLLGAKARLIEPPLWNRLEEVWAWQTSGDADRDPDDEATPELRQAARRRASPIALRPDGLPFRRFAVGAQLPGLMPWWYRDTDSISEAVDLMKAHLEEDSESFLQMLAEELGNPDDVIREDDLARNNDLARALDDLEQVARSDEWFDHYPMWSWFESYFSETFFIEESSDTPERFGKHLRRPPKLDWPDGNAVPRFSG